jgi:hypothetical protein
MRKKDGSQNRLPFLQMIEIKMEKLYMIHQNLPMILTIENILPNIEFRHWMKMGNRKPVLEKVKERNISGKGSLFRQMTGMNTVNASSGENHGLNIVTDIFHLNYILITGLMKDRGWRLNQPSMKV